MVYFVFILGIIIGSFLLVVGTRLPLKKKFVNDRSKCDNCNLILRWYDLVPILSFLFLKGKCRHCNTKINILHLISEIATGILFVFLYLKFNFSYEFFVGIVLATLLVLITITDFKYFVILDSALIVSGILILIIQFIFLDYYILLLNIASGAGMFLFMYCVKKIGDELFHRESMGGGDIKFAAIIGLSVGFNLSMFVLLLSVFLTLPTAVAAILISKNKEVPYGPFLCGALFIVFIFADKFTALINYIIA